MYDFRNAGINPDTGLTYQEEYEASLQEDSGINWDNVAGVLGTIGTGVLGTLYGGTSGATTPAIEEEKTIAGLKASTFYTIIGLAIVVGLIALIIKLRRSGKLKF